MKTGKGVRIPLPRAMDRTSVRMKHLRGYVRMLKKERGDISQLNGALRIRMLKEIRQALADGITVAHIGIDQAIELEAIVTKVEKRTFRDLEHDQSILTIVRMTEEELLMFFRSFLHDLLVDEDRARISEIRRKEAEYRTTERP